MTRLPVRSLERLEAGVFDGQHDGFVRGFVRTVAVAIGLDPDDAVARLLAEPEQRRRRRLPDPRRIALVAVGLAAIGAATAAVVEFGRSRVPVATAPSEAVLVRRDAVRALAVEYRLLAEDPAAVLLPPLPAAPSGPPRDPSKPLGAARSTSNAESAPDSAGGPLPAAAAHLAPPALTDAPPATGAAPLAKRADPPPAARADPPPAAPE